MTTDPLTGARCALPIHARSSGSALAAPACQPCFIPRRSLQPHIVDLSTSNSAPDEDGSKPCSISQRAATTPPRPPRPDHVEVEVGAVASDEIGKVLLMSERQDGQVVQRIARSCLGPINHAGDLVTVDEHMVRHEALLVRMEVGD